jgi:hypothetical protein
MIGQLLLTLALSQQTQQQPPPQTQTFGVRINQWNDPEYLESLRADGKRVSLRVNDANQLDLIVKAPDGY